MATHQMRLFRFTAGSTDKVWAICADGGRVLVFHGKYTDRQLRGGPVTIATGRGTHTEMESRIEAQLRQGYSELGTYRVKDREVQWEDEGEVSQSAPRPNFALLGYASFAMTDVGKVKDALQRAFEVREIQGSLEISIPGRSTIVWDVTSTAPTMSATEQDGAWGVLCLLVAARAVGSTVYDADGRERNARWLLEEPRFADEIPELRAVAVQLGFMVTKAQVSESTRRIALW